jgi:hypothetical protein
MTAGTGIRALPVLLIGIQHIVRRTDAARAGVITFKVPTHDVAAEQA